MAFPPVCRNKGNCAQRTIDLHGLHVNEALTVTDELVSQSVNDRFNGKPAALFKASRLRGTNRILPAKSIILLLGTDRLRAASADNWCELITGCGNHSVANIPKLQRAVLAYLKQRGIVSVVHPGNKGIVCFRITRGMRLQPYDRSTLRISS